MELPEGMKKFEFLLNPPAIDPEGDDTELQYNPLFWSKKYENIEEQMKQYYYMVTQSSQTAKETIPCQLDVSYGKADGQKAHIFGTDLPKDAPIFVFLHGGYWIFGSRDESCHFVKSFYDAGVVSVVMGYDLANESFTITQIVDEIIEGFKFVLDYASSRKSKGVYLCGHSAGAHLVTTALSVGDFDKDKINLIKGVISLGGLFDLEPLLKHSVGKVANITREVVDASSPSAFTEKLAKNLNPSTKVFIVTADQESPAFQTQSREYEKKLKTAGMNSKFVMLEDEDHGTMGSRLSENDFILTKDILEMIHGN